MKTQIADAPMNIQFHFFGLNSNRQASEMIVPDLVQLHRQVSINSAAVVFDRTRNGGPPFAVRVHLAVSGPDIHAEARDHTLQGAWRKVCKNLEKQIEQRKTKQAARVKSNRQQPISKTRWSRPAMPR
jgi:ribosome-associated translation inhibitor RaiA